MFFSVLKGYLFKETRELLRDKVFWFLYAIPVVSFILFATGIKLTVKNVPLAVVDYDNSKLSLEIINSLSHNGYFSVSVIPSEERAFKELKRGKFEGVLIIPSHFEANLLKGLKTEIGIFSDASYPFRGSTVESYISFSVLQKLYELQPQKGRFVELNGRFLFNQSLRDENANVPALFAILLLVVPAMLSSLLVVREKEQGTIFNFYTSPVPKAVFLIAKAIPPLVLYSLVFPILLFLSLYLFNVPFRGNLFFFWLSSEVYILTGVAVGVLISVFVSSQVVALIASAIVTIIPGFLYSGMLIPISSFEGISKIEAHLLPVYYYSLISYDSFLVGRNPLELLGYFLLLLFYPLFFFLTALVFLRKKVD